MSSQQTFVAVLNRFKNGNALVQSWLDFAPGNPLIIKAALVPFITSIEGANTDVTTTEEAVGVARAVRNPLVFENKDTNPTCLETRIRGIVNDLRSNPDNAAFATAAKKVNTILKKMRPHYPKKAPGTPRGAGNSPAEKSFASAVGHGRAVITIISGLGALYLPADNNLKVINMTALVDLIETENQNVQEALDNYGTANRLRNKLYKEKDGLEKRRSAILKYLSSFPGLTKSSHYIEFNQAIKGT